jgi:hypothetical protein
MKRIKAYVLAADPTWLEKSVGAYYPLVDEIVVSYDSSSRGWTGAPVPVEECLTRLSVLDGDRKMRFVPGDFSSPVQDPMQNDTFQRGVALQLASQDADWVLQLDTDEWLPEPQALIECIKDADHMGVGGVEWPMRVLYRRLGMTRALEVCAPDGGDHFEYIAPVAVRAGSRLRHSRRTGGSILRAVVRGDSRSIQLNRPLETGEVRQERLHPNQAILHNSWARTPIELMRKLASWSHSGASAWRHFLLRWLPSPLLWRHQHNVHPLFGSVWPALRECPFALPSLDRLPVLACGHCSCHTPKAACGDDW